ncbi:hypothetical protein PV325_007867 [Microctonus aethiopoides]|nr:hypothetical protein PV325_007867 [Microctonus aethiopoides]KAK0079058.1 hypothetical protein PV326_008954 [Microctonus aethiopoides]
MQGEGCLEKPISTLWRNYVSNNRPDVAMKLTVTNGGLTATTKDHGLTEYWAHRITYSTASSFHPLLFVWIYRHEGRKLRPELRCHAALCTKESIAKKLATTLDGRLHQALHEFRRDKISRQNARLSLANAVYENPSLPRRKILLSTGGQNYRPPLERSRSAPKLSAIVEDSAAEEIEQKRLLEEMRSFKGVARSWRGQDSWSLARFVHALNHTAAPCEYLEDNQNVSSKCKSMSDSYSEHTAIDVQDGNMRVDSEILLDRKVLRTDQVIRSSSTAELGMNFTRNGTDYALEEATKKLEKEELSNIFDFKDTQIFHELVDYRPLGDEDSIGMKDNAGTDMGGNVGEYFTHENQMDKPLTIQQSHLVTFESCDQIEICSDKRACVGVLPTAVFEKNKDKHAVKSFDDVDAHSDYDHIITEAIDGDEMMNINGNLQALNKMHQQRSESRKKADSTEDSVSKMMKKMTSASLCVSKSPEILTNDCLKALDIPNDSKLFSRVTTIDYEDQLSTMHSNEQLLTYQDFII